MKFILIPWDGQIHIISDGDEELLVQIDEWPEGINKLWDCLMEINTGEREGIKLHPNLSCTAS